MCFLVSFSLQMGLRNCYRGTTSTMTTDVMTLTPTSHMHCHGPALCSDPPSHFSGGLKSTPAGLVYKTFFSKFSFLAMCPTGLSHSSHISVFSPSEVPDFSAYRCPWSASTNHMSLPLQKLRLNLPASQGQEHHYQMARQARLHPT